MDMGYLLFAAFWMWVLWLFVRRYLRGRRRPVASPGEYKFVVTATGPSEEHGTVAGFFVSPNGGAHRQKWSGVDKGPMPLKALTVAQDMCLSDAAGVGARLTRSSAMPGYVLAGSDTAAHPSRTIKTLERHGLLAASGNEFVITDRGLQALETLRMRL